MIRRAKETRRTRAELRASILGAIETILARGEHPSPGRIARIVGVHRNVSRRWRDRLLAEGAVEFELLNRGPQHGKGSDVGGLLGETPEEVAEIQARFAAVRAEKIAAREAASCESELGRPRLARIVVYAGPDEAWEGGGS